MGKHVKRGKYSGSKVYLKAGLLSGFYKDKPKGSLGLPPPETKDISAPTFDFFFEELDYQLPHDVWSWGLYQGGSRFTANVKWFQCTTCKVLLENEESIKNHVEKKHERKEAKRSLDYWMVDIAIMPKLRYPQSADVALKEESRARTPSPPLLQPEVDVERRDFECTLADVDDLDDDAASMNSDSMMSSCSVGADEARRRSYRSLVKDCPTLEPFTADALPAENKLSRSRSRKTKGNTTNNRSSNKGNKSKTRNSAANYQPRKRNGRFTSHRNEVPIQRSGGKFESIENSQEEGSYSEQYPNLTPAHGKEMDTQGNSHEVEQEYPIYQGIHDITKDIGNLELRSVESDAHPVHSSYPSKVYREGQQDGTNIASSDHDLRPTGQKSDQGDHLSEPLANTQKCKTLKFMAALGLSRRSSGAYRNDSDAGCEREVGGDVEVTGTENSNGDTDRLPIERKDNSHQRQSHALEKPTLNTYPEIEDQVTKPEEPALLMLSSETYKDTKPNEAVCKLNSITDSSESEVIWEELLSKTAANVSRKSSKTQSNTVEACDTFRQIHNVQEDTFNCSLCCMKFTSISELHSHENQIHAPSINGKDAGNVVLVSPSPLNNEDKQFTEVEIEYAAPLRLDSKQHKRQGVAVRHTWSVNKWGRPCIPFIQGNRYRSRHIRKSESRSNETNAPYKKKFRLRESRGIVEIRGSGEDSSISSDCAYCSATFTNVHDTQFHKLQHTGFWKGLPNAAQQKLTDIAQWNTPSSYKCPYPSCSLVSPSLGTFLEHATSISHAWDPSDPVERRPSDDDSDFFCFICQETVPCQTNREMKIHLILQHPFVDRTSCTECSAPCAGETHLHFHNITHTDLWGTLNGEERTELEWAYCYAPPGRKIWCPIPSCSTLPPFSAVENFRQHFHTFHDSQNNGATVPIIKTEPYSNEDEQIDVY